MTSIRYYGHHAQGTGYGHAARELTAALSRLGAVVDIRTMGPHGTGWLQRELDGQPDVVIVHTLPADCHKVLELEGLRRGGGTKLVAQSTWEALTAPLEIVQPLYDCFDQVWTPSRSSALALGANGLHSSGRDRARAEAITHVVPHCYNVDADRPQAPDTHDGIFRFYWIGAWSARKNPAGLIRAFAHTFRSHEDVELVVHSPGCSIEAFTATLAAAGLQQGELPSIRLSNRHLEDTQLAELHACADCFVSAARGEAWNLPAFDAMLAGRHVITQFGLGSDEFLAETSADLIDGWESPAQVDVAHVATEGGEMRLKVIGAQGLTARSLWLEPNLSSLANAMRHAFESRNRTIKIDYDPAARFGYAAVAKQVLELLEAT